MTEKRSLTIFSLANSLLCAGMAVCLATVTGRLIGTFGVSSLEKLFILPNGLIAGLFLVSLEVQWTRRLLAPRDLFSPEWWQAIGVEWFLLLLGLWALIWVAEGPEFAREDLRAMANLNFMGLIRAEHMVGLLLLVLVWGFNRVLVADLMSMENFSPPVSSEGLRDIEATRAGARNRLWQVVFTAGGLMLAVSLAGSAILRTFRSDSAAIGPLGTETLVYFLCGLGLLAISRLMILRVDWILDRTQLDAGIPGRWLTYSLGFILILIFFAAALPTNYSLSLLTSLGLAFQGLAGILIVLWSLLVLPILLLASFLLSWIKSGARPDPLDDARRSLEDMYPALPAGFTWIAVLREIFLFVIVVFVAVYFLRQLLKLRRAILRRVRGWPVLGWFLDWLRRFGHRVAGWRRAVGRAIHNSLSALREDISRHTGWEPLGLVNLRALTPRQSIRFYFFALLRRGAERGAARTPAQTPREYADGLAAKEESIGGDLREMALAFEEARYTAHTIGPEKSHRVRKLWTAVRAKMRRFGEDAGNGGKAGA